MTKAAHGLVFAVIYLAGVSAIKWENLYLKFGLDGYYPIALDLDDLDMEFEYMARDNDLKVDFYSYALDPRVAIGFDQYGSIAGVRVSYVIEDITKRAEEKGLTFPYSFTDKALYSNGTFNDQDVYYTTVLFVSPDDLRRGGRAHTDGLLGKNLYVKLDGKYKAMPKKEADAPAFGFYKQACFVGMGQHYFLGVTEDSDCADHQGVFLLYEGGDLIGMGLIPFGSFTNGLRPWFEDPPAQVVEMITPDRPPCLTEWTTNYGLTGLHFFFKKHPRMTFCL